MKIGERARLVVHVPEGIVIDKEFHKEADEVQCLLAYNGPDGEVVHRWFLESQLAPLPVQEGGAA